eukprot:291489_1
MGSFKKSLKTVTRSFKNERDYRNLNGSHEPNGALDDLHEPLTLLPIDSGEAVISPEEFVRRTEKLSVVELERMLLQSAKQGNCDMIRQLVLKDVSIHCKEEGVTDEQTGFVRGRTQNSPLHLACQYRQLKAVELLCNLEADMEIRNVLGTTPLGMAAGVGALEIVELLLKYGVKHDAENKIGNTALHIASYSGNAGVCRVLLEFDPDSREAVTQKNRAGMSPFDYSNSNEVRALLVEYLRPESSRPSKIDEKADEV